MTPITEVANTGSIRSAEFVKLTILNFSTATSTTSTQDVYISTSYKSEVIAGNTYTPAISVMSIGQQQRDINVTSFDTAIGFTNLDGESIPLVLGNQIRGSKVEIRRGFYDTNGVLQNTYLRFTGVVTSYNITENRQDRDDNFDIVLACSSFRTVLENNRGGRRTNGDTWPNDSSLGTDTSMDNVAALNGAYFDFGVPVSTPTPGGGGGGQDTPETIPS